MKKDKICEFCHQSVNRVFEITVPYKGALLPYDYCELCLSYIETQLKKINHEKILNH